MNRRVRQIILCCGFFVLLDIYFLIWEPQEIASEGFLWMNGILLAGIIVVVASILLERKA